MNWIFKKKTFLYNVLTLLCLISFQVNLFANESCVDCPPGNVMYVNQSIAVPGDGSSWANAHIELRDAIAATFVCPNVTEIWVAAGTYKPNSATNQIVFFEMRNNMAWYGGFNGTETLRSQRDWKANPTILSGDLLGDDDYSVSPPGNQVDNSYHVIFNFNTNIDHTAILDGFHITAGNANVAPPNHVGGGLYNKLASPTVANCLFYNNNAGYGGGGNYNDKSTISFTNCEFYNNTTTYRGGAMYCDASTWTITNCIFYDNHAMLPNMGVGGAIFNNGSAPTIVNSTFVNNSATHIGGAIQNNGFADPFFYNCIFWNNGDEIANTDDDPNTAPAILNSIADVVVQNCIIKNSGNSGSGWNPFYGFDYGGNSEMDPMFVDAANGDFRLQQCSPAIDAGENSFIPSGVTLDLDLNPRIIASYNGAAVDMGAYEYQMTANCCVVGAPCNDLNDCTQNETIQPDCSCGGGLLADNDDDGVCDTDPADNCFGPNIGDFCDDGNPCTINTIILPTCECAGGEPFDNDNDGFCDLDLINDNCVGPNIGDNCDDGNPCTINDLVQADCSCVGTNDGDDDMDGLCDNDPADDCFGPNSGDACDDGNDCTTGETVQFDCTCGGGTLLDIDNDGLCDTDPADNCVGPNIGSNCDDGDICTVGETIQDDCNCGGGMLVDFDNDGICDSDPADNCTGPNIGDACDGDPCLTGQTIQSDCNCGGGTLLDDDMDGLCDNLLADNCFGPNIGEACDDGDDCMVGEIVQPDCSCGGAVLLDGDGDGVCDTDPADDCPGANSGSPCDDGDPETLEDVIAEDCSCVGTTDTNDLNNGIAISLFPIPADEGVFLSIKNYEGGEGTISIYNAFGQLLLEKEFDQILTIPIHLDINHFGSGVYFMVIELKGVPLLSRKFVVSKL